MANRRRYYNRPVLCRQHHQESIEKYSRMMVERMSKSKQKNCWPVSKQTGLKDIHFLLR